MKDILPKGSKKLLNAWAFYDWANSVYSLVINSAIFPLFYAAISVEAFEKGNVPDMLKGVNNESIIIVTTAIAFLIVSIISPILSGIADYSGQKKRFLQFFCYLGAFSCIGLAAFSFDYLWISLIIYMLALIGFWGSLVFYNSYLPDIAFPEQQDAISSKGFSLGYLGSVLLLAFCLCMTVFGLYPESGEILGLDAVQMSFILVGIWWMSFAQYTYKYLPLGTKKDRSEVKNIFTNGFQELKKIWSNLSENKQMKRYLGAFFIYSMAVQTVMLVATYFGTEEVKWDKNGATFGLIMSIMLIQFVAILGAWLASLLSRKLGNIKTLIIINILWALICVYGYFVVTPLQFYITAGFVGLVMGSIQSLSRSTYSKMIPEGNLDTASYFSFYDVAEKIGIVIGMLIFAIVGEISGSMREPILFLIVFFITGIILLIRVPRLQK
ncbi:UMF1 family MFS transporter [Nonlabens dokdonensis]|uniref:Major facilitator superfamily permease n=2 Tax=Nonlabens dokdonensis TaxID=328515 RepID=L7WGT1_NONDD|nr:MFS transporter [Nonlabens dokdonensis]AGC78158.1 major facilitator superfamily permease [Nonlabens dokdonensis DSW-6]PZX37949.1 UMF1 family MFS transporter [Nonlabens dokdonensis]